MCCARVLLEGGRCHATASLPKRLLTDAEVARLPENRAGTLDAETPLLIAGTQASQTLLLMPLDADADAAGVAERIMRTAAARGLRGTVLDLSAAPSGAHVGNGTISSMHSELDMVAVRMRNLTTDATLGALGGGPAVLFVATAGGLDRRGLESGIETLKRFGVPCAGVVLSRRRSRALARL